jgi:hypothetical protein
MYNASGWLPYLTPYLSLSILARGTSKTTWTPFAPAWEKGRG